MKNNREHDRLAHRAQRERFKAVGACPNCGKPVQKFVYCQRCRRMNARTALRRYHAQKYGAA